MFEFDWTTATDPVEMLEHLYPLRGLDSVEPQTRPSRLYLQACARRAWDCLPGLCRAVVAVSEQVYRSRTFDRRLRTEVYQLVEEMTNCRGDATRINGLGRELAALGHANSTDVSINEDIDPDLWTGFAFLSFYPFHRTTPHYRRIPADLHAADLLREVFGNPSVHGAPFNPLWRTVTVRNLARHVHASGEFSVLPVLADALEDAGCDREDILDHLRSRDCHVHGCWALELVLE